LAWCADYRVVEDILPIEFPVIEWVVAVDSSRRLVEFGQVDIKALRICESLTRLKKGLCDGYGEIFPIGTESFVVLMMLRFIKGLTILD